MTPTSSVDTVDTTRATPRGWRDDRGMSTLEAILTIPVLVAMFLAVVQVAMWWYARQLGATAAQEASRTARAYASTAIAGHDRGEEYLTLQQANGHALTDVQVHVRRSATTVTVTVTGYTVSLVPYLKLRISETSSGPVERYVPPQCAPIQATPIAASDRVPGRRPRRGSTLGRGLRGEDGMLTLELVLWAPVIALVLMIVVGGGRVVHARSLADGAARDASRAASLYRGAGTGQAAAETAAHASLDAAGISCHPMRVQISGGHQPGDVITATVYCTAAMSDLAIPWFPGAYTLHSAASTPIEKTRSTQ